MPTKDEIKAVAQLYMQVYSGTMQILTLHGPDCDIAWIVRQFDALDPSWVVKAVQRARADYMREVERIKLN